MRIGLQVSRSPVVRSVAYGALGAVAALALVTILAPSEAMDGVLQPLPKGFHRVALSNQSPANAPVPPKGHKLIAFGESAFPFQEEGPPQVWPCEPAADSKGQGPVVSLTPKPNWALRPGDLAGEASFELIEGPSGIGGRIHQTCRAQTPAGIVESDPQFTEIAPTELWASASRFKGRFEFDVMAGGSTELGLEGGARWRRPGRRIGGYALAEWRPLADVGEPRWVVHGGLTLRIGRK